MNIENEIKKLKKYARENGLYIRFRNHRTAQGDFCIFIYCPSYRKSYAVGFDGNSKCDFASCVRMAYKWIENRDSRFVKKDGVWVSI